MVGDELPLPRPGEEWALIWRDPETHETKVKAATDEGLLVIKMLADEIGLDEAAAQGNISVLAIQRAINRAAEQGLVLAPRSAIRRDPSAFPLGDTPEDYLSARAFTLQWHVTQACDLHCKHCYDRSKRSPLTFDQALRILDGLAAFCEARRVTGHTCFTGGNPFLYPHFFDVYRAAAERGFSMSVLGNPVPRPQVGTLVGIQMPSYFQVSLEGLPEHNDEVRGQGHFARVIEFLGVLRDMDVSSAVMLTLTQDNIDHVLPLAERLRGHTDHFTFNRLSQVGEGAALELPSRDEYERFLEAYVEAAQHNPILGYKDNLINIVRHRRGMEPFDGCTGFGCGAAFNFMAVLPDGEAHACRKFPSPIGNVLEQTVAGVYESDLAKRYRRGTAACRSCPIRPTCGGCMAVTHGHGLDVSVDRDPCCFFEGC